MIRPISALALALLTLFPQALPATEIDPTTSELFLGDEFDWLMGDDLLRLQKAGDPAALRAVADLFRQGHARASVALENYLERYPRDPAAYDLAGTELLRQKNYPAAVTSFWRAVSLDPDATWSRAKLGTARLLAGDVEAGLADLEQVIEDDPDNPLARRYLAWAALQDGNLPLAIMHSERALKAFGLPRGRINQAHLDLAELYRRAGRNEAVLALLGPAAMNDGLDLPRAVAAEVLGRYLEAAIAASQPEEARAALARLGAIGLADALPVQLSSARLMILEGKAEAAIEAIQAIRAAHPDIAADLVPDLARAEAAAGHPEAAAERLAGLAAVRGPGADLPLLRDAAVVLLDAGRVDAAIALVEDARTAAPGRPDLLHLAAEVLARAGRTDDALALAQDLVAREPGVALGHYLLGTLLYETGLKAEAEASLRRALALEPANPGAWMTLVGVVHGHDTYGHEGGGHGEVEAILDEAIAANPGSALLQNELGLLRLSDGKPTEAIAAFDAALERAPGYLPALSLGALARADAGTDLTAAEELVTLALAMAPDDPIATDIAGWIDFRQGELATAEALIGKALAIAPNDTTTHYHMGILDEAEGRPEAAREHLLTALAGGDMYRHYEAGAREALARIEPGPELTLPVAALDSGAPLGTLTLRQTEAGLSVTADLADLPPGEHAIGIHLRPTCAPGGGAPGGAAGALYGAAHDHGDAAPPEDTSAHDHAAPQDQAEADHPHPEGTPAHDHADSAPNGHAVVELAHAEGGPDHGHDAAAPRGELGPIQVGADGHATASLTAPQLTLAEIRGRSVIVQAGSDASSAWIACAIIP